LGKDGPEEGPSDGSEAAKLRGLEKKTKIARQPRKAIDRQQEKGNSCPLEGPGDRSKELKKENRHISERKGGKDIRKKPLMNVTAKEAPRGGRDQRFPATRLQGKRKFLTSLQRFKVRLANVKTIGGGGLKKGKGE